MKSVINKITDLDNFAPAVTLNFRGKDRFKTTRGGIITIVSYIAVLILGIELLERWITLKDPVIAQYEIFGNLEGELVLE